VHAHKLDHLLWEEVSRHIGDACDDAPFELSLLPRQATSKTQVVSLAVEIAQVIRSHAPHMHPGQTIDFQELCPGVLQKQFSDQRNDDEPQTGLVISSVEPRHPELDDAASTPDEFKENVLRYFAECERKFVTFADSTRVLVLNVVSAQLHGQCDGPWWKTFFAAVVPPAAISQIWTSFNYHGESWQFECVHGYG